MQPHFGNGATAAIETWPKARTGKQPTKPRLVFARDVAFDPAVTDPVKGLIGAGEVGFLFGPSSAGKTFVAFDLATAIAMGRDDWCGRRIKPGAVLHVAFEGGKGARKRLLAATLEHGDPGDKLAILDTVPPLNKGAENAGVIAIVAAAGELAKVAGVHVALIVIDTLSAAAPGDDENQAADMSAFVAKLKVIAERTRAAVVAIHHTGKTVANGMRGSAALRGNADYVIELTDARDLVIEKCREGRTGPLGSFELKQVELGTDDDGDVATSCVVRFRPGTGATSKPTKALTPPARNALSLLQDLYSSGKAAPVRPDLINGVEVARCVEQHTWRAACRQRELTQADDDPVKKAAAEKKAFQRAVTALEAAGLIGTYGGYIWLTRQEPAQGKGSEGGLWANM